LSSTKSIATAGAICGGRAVRAWAVLAHNVCNAAGHRELSSERVAGGMSRIIDALLSIGAYQEESETQRARRRIILAITWVASLLTVLTILGEFLSGLLWVALSHTGIIVVTAVMLMALHLAPRRFALLISLLLGTVFVVGLIVTTLFGGLFESGLIVIFNLAIVLAALLAFDNRAASWWFAAFVASVVYATLIHNRIDPVYKPLPSSVAAFNLISLGVLTFVATVYFVRQRDRFQKQSDDLLHNILPDEVAARLKAHTSMIADSFASASVLFADVVDFTPMSARMSAAELVALLNRIFTSFDALVDELALEKIKTIGDAYMVASGVPVPRRDHAEAVADLALRLRDHVASKEFEGRRIRLRIGINSGPVVAGIIGTHKFAYDLWGDVVNTASRMESEGLPGSIQISRSTFSLIEDRFVCERRGLIPVKGKGEMDTYILISKRFEDGRSTAL
jgi:adenylate cyclase